MTVSLLDLFDGRAAAGRCTTSCSGRSGTRAARAARPPPTGSAGCASDRAEHLAGGGLARYLKLAAFRERMGWEFPWDSSYGSDFNYDFHATLDDRVAPVLLHFRTQDELAEAGTPWDGRAVDRGHER